MEEIQVGDKHRVPISQLLETTTSLIVSDFCGPDLQNKDYQIKVRLCFDDRRWNSTSATTVCVNRLELFTLNFVSIASATQQVTYLYGIRCKAKAHKSNSGVEFGAQSAFLCVVEYDDGKSLH
jgi:hypothetical protein